MTDPRFAFKHVLEHEIHVTEWGDPANPAIVMWHGLARTGRDFDELARALSDRYFVLCPDTIGRGLSSWSRDPMAEYTVEFYEGIATDLLDAYGIERAGWLGTSMGGMIGMRLASGPQADRVAWLLLNDIGPEVPPPALERILYYATQRPVFADHTEAEAWLRRVYAPFGKNTDAFWRRMVRSSVRRKDDGALTLHYDPQIIEAMLRPETAGLDTWPRWDKISAPTHLIYGAVSDILPHELATRMAERGPKPGLTVIPDVGHTPTLARPEEAVMVAQIIDRLVAQG